MTDNCDTHAPPPGYSQRPLGFDPQGDPAPPEGVAVAAISVAAYPAIIHALNLIRMDSGGPSWPPTDAPNVPVRWLPFLPTIEEALNGLDGGDRSRLDLDGELCTFCSGEEKDVLTIVSRSIGLRLASVFLDDFFEGWTYIEERAVQ